MRTASEAGHNVYLITSKKNEHEPWPKEHLEDVFVMQEDELGEWNLDDLLEGVAHLSRSLRIDKVVALDDFDVERAALVREQFRIPGMGQTTARYFRDKLAMRVQANDHGIGIPAFSALFNDDQINEFTRSSSTPWVVKPRSQASAAGIKKVASEEELWQHLEALGEDRHNFLIEQFRPGDVFHVDGLVVSGEVIFSRTSGYLDTPMNVAHEGGIFRSAILEYGSDIESGLKSINGDVLKAFGMQYGAFHSEYIRSQETGDLVFLETSSRVGGAHLAEMVEASSGVDLWSEWANIEISQMADGAYQLPDTFEKYAGIVVSLIRFKDPDYSSFQDPEIVWKLEKDHHIGLIVQSDDRETILSRLDSYTQRIGDEFHASAPPKDRPTA